MGTAAKFIFEEETYTEYNLHTIEPTVKQVLLTPFVSPEQNPSSVVNTVTTLNEAPLKLSKTSTQSTTAKTKIVLEAEFNCVISEIIEKKAIVARVYDPKENIQVMEIDLPFSSFDKDDQKLIKLNAIFYWRVGTKKSYLKKHSESFTSKNFSSFKMKRVYTSKIFHERKILSQLNAFNSVFSD